MSGTHGFLDLISYLENQYEENRGYIKSLDDRFIFCESKHKLLNSLLQSSGAIFMKYYLVDVFDSLSKKYRLDKDYSFICNIHDAIVIRTKENIADDIAKIIEKSFTNVSNKFGFLHPIKGEAIKGYDLYSIFL